MPICKYLALYIGFLDPPGLSTNLDLKEKNMVLEYHRNFGIIGISHIWRQHFCLINPTLAGDGSGMIRPLSEMDSCQASEDGSRAENAGIRKPYTYTYNNKHQHQHYLRKKCHQTPMLIGTSRYDHSIIGYI